MTHLVSFSEICDYYFMSSSLKYFLSETHYFERDYSVLIVTLVGSLTKDSQNAFTHCLEQVQKSSARWAIVNFRDVSGDADEATYSCFTELSKLIRGRGVGVRLSGIHLKLRKELFDRNLFEATEVVNNLHEALESLPLPK